MKIQSFLILVSVALLWTACSENSQEKVVKTTKNEKSPEELGVEDDGRGGDFEDYMALVDNNDSLLTASTLYFSKGDGESYQLYLLLNNEGNIIRTEERYTKSGDGSVLRNFHYFRDEVRIASKEIYNQGTGEAENFFERVSYYDEKEKPVISKIRKAQFEEYLENEMFRIIDPINCPLDRADRALAGEGEFETKFLSVIEQDGVFYIIVGEDKDNGYNSSLVVQSITPLIQSLINNPDAYKGEPVKVDFQEMPDGQGYTFQSLLGISLANN